MTCSMKAKPLTHYPVGLYLVQHSFRPGPGTSSGIYWSPLGKQVTASSLRLVDAKTRRQLTEWKAPAPISINVATANVSQVCPSDPFHLYWT